MFLADYIIVSIVVHIQYPSTWCCNSPLFRNITQTYHSWRRRHSSRHPGSMLLWYLFPSMLRNSGNKHKNNPLVSAETVRHSSTYIILYFLHDRPWISPWIKSISNELDIICHVFASQLSGHCDVIANRLWRHQQNVKRASETRGWCVKILVFSVIFGFVMSCKK